MISALAVIFPFSHPIASASIIFPVSEKTQITTSQPLELLSFVVKFNPKKRILDFVSVSCVLNSPPLAPLLYFKHVNSPGALGENKYIFNFELRNSPADFN